MSLFAANNKRCDGVNHFITIEQVELPNFFGGSPELKVYDKLIPCCAAIKIQDDRFTVDCTSDIKIEEWKILDKGKLEENKNV